MTGERLISSEVHGQADAYLEQLHGLYRGRADLAEPLARFELQTGDALNDGERVRLFARTVLAPLDREARRLVTRGARDIGALTALSLLGLLDSAIVLWRTLIMLRAIARPYGGRPGIAASLRLLRRTLAHVLAAGVGELLSDAAIETAGASLLSVLSARLGQGAVHGLLAARLGLAAVQICRPVPFVEGELPSMKQLRTELFDQARRARPRSTQVSARGPRRIRLAAAAAPPWQPLTRRRSNATPSGLIDA